MPELTELLDDLFFYLDCECVVIDCDNTFKRVEKWIEENGYQSRKDEIIEYLNENGAYCDCEVIFNVAPDEYSEDEDDFEDDDDEDFDEDEDEYDEDDEDEDESK